MDEFKKNYMNEEDVATVELLPLITAVLQRWWVVAIVAVVFAVGTFVGTKLFVTPTYRAGFTAYVNNRTDSEEQTVLSNADLSASRYLTYTYAQIISSRSVLEEAAAQAGLDYDYNTLKGFVSTSILSDTEIIGVYVTTPDPAISKTLADAIAAVATAQVSNIVDGSSMRIIDAAVTPEGIYSPNYLKNAVIGAALGFLLCVGVIVLREILDDRVRDEESLESRFGIPILGTIPNTSAAAKSGNNYYYAYGGNQSRGGNK